MLTENEVVDAVATHLQGRGYSITSKCSTQERGIDIVAEHTAAGKQLLVEAKGGTSSKEGTARFGNPFTPSQAKTHVAVAFYYAAMLRQKYAHETAQVALAFPKDEAHCALVKDISTALDALGISVFFVDTTRKVTATGKAAQQIIPPDLPRQAAPSRASSVNSNVRSTC